MAWTSPIFCRNAYRVPIVSVDELQRRTETVDCRSGSANGMIFYPQSAPHSTHLTAKANGRSSSRQLKPLLSDVSNRSRAYQRRPSPHGRELEEVARPTLSIV
jgi:hypothetical protein